MDDVEINPKDLPPFKGAKEAVRVYVEEAFCDGYPPSFHHCLRAVWKLDIYQRMMAEIVRTRIEGSTVPGSTAWHLYMDSYDTAMKILRRTRGQFDYWRRGYKGQWKPTWNESCN